MSILIDTNVLVRWAQPSHPAHTVAVQSVGSLLARRTPVYYTAQNVIEFWNVATRPAANNGLGLPPDLVRAELANMEGLLTLVPDSPAIYREWKDLVLKYGVTGVRVHDARLAAVALANNISSILTFNTADFIRYSHLAVVHPSGI